MNDIRFKAWAVLGASPAPWNVNGPYVGGVNGEFVAMCDCDASDRADANVRAVSALPELYDALVYLTNASMDLVVDCPALDKARAMAIAAIRKAAGEITAETEDKKMAHCKKWREYSDIADAVRDKLTDMDVCEAVDLLVDWFGLDLEDGGLARELIDRGDASEDDFAGFEIDEGAAQ